MYYNIIPQETTYDLVRPRAQAGSAFMCTFGHVHSFFYKNVVFPAQAEYSYFSADFRLKIFLYYS